VCCGTEREVTIDCPSNCPHLVASRQYEHERREIDWENIPFPDVEIDPSFARSHDGLLTGINYAICEFARKNRQVVDADVAAALQALAEAYRTLASGIYYEQLPTYLPQRELYQALTAALADYKKAEAERFGLSSTRDGEIRDALIFFARMGATRTNGRPKGRAYLDFLWSQLPPEARGRPESGVILLP
jgi:hypothetical protein